MKIDTENATPKRDRSSRRSAALPRGIRAAWERIPGGHGIGNGGDPRGLLVPLALAGAVALTGLFHVWTRSENLRLGYAIAAEETRARDAIGEQARLNVEIGSLSSPVRIARLAEERLGLRAPEPGQIIDLPGRERDSGQVLAASSLARRR